MERAFRFAQRSLVYACLLLTAAAVAVGCHSACKTGDCSSCKNCGGHNGCQNLSVDNCSDIPQGAIPLPAGTYMNEFFARQAGKAEADDFVFYYNEWVDDQAVLGPYGTEHIDRVVARLPLVQFPIIVQPEPNRPILSTLRRQALIDSLRKAGVADAEQRVFVGRSAAEGLFGDEAERIYPQLVHGGFAGSGGGGYGGGFVGFGGVGFGGGGIGGFGGNAFNFR